jgi:hypothetical protein
VDSELDGPVGRPRLGESAPKFAQSELRCRRHLLKDGARQFCLPTQAVVRNCFTVRRENLNDEVFLRLAR